MPVELINHEIYQVSESHFYAQFFGGSTLFEIDLNEAQTIAALEQTNAVLVAKKYRDIDGQLFLITEYSQAGQDIEEREMAAADLLACIDFDIAEKICQHIYSQTKSEQAENGWTFSEFCKELQF